MPTTSSSALTRLDTPDGQSAVPVLAYALAGKLTGADVDAIQADLAGHERVRLLVRMDALSMPDASSFSSHLMSMKAEAMGKIERYAIVGGPSWLTGLVSVVGALAPFAIRHFDDQAAATAWVQSAATADEIEDRVEAAEKAAPAVTLLPSHRGDLVALHVDGHITAEDYEAVVDPAIEAALADHDAVDLLVRFGHLDGFSLGAAKEDAALAGKLGQFRKMALVGGPGWLTTMADTVGKLVPVEVQTFDDEAPARAWLGATA